MPFEYHIEETIVTVSGFGESSLTECLEALHHVMADVKFKSHLPVIVDLSRIHYTPSLSDISHIAGISKELCTHFKSKVAVVVSGLLHFSLASTLRHLTESHGLSIDVFFRHDSALNWATTPGACI